MEEEVDAGVVSIELMSAGENLEVETCGMAAGAVQVADFGGFGAGPFWSEEFVPVAGLDPECAGADEGGELGIKEGGKVKGVRSEFLTARGEGAGRAPSAQGTDTQSGVGAVEAARVKRFRKIVSKTLT